MSICIIHLSDGKVAGVYSNTHEPMEVMVMERDGPRMTEEQQARYRAFQTMVKYGLVMDWQNPPYPVPCAPEFAPNLLDELLVRPKDGTADRERQRLGAVLRYGLSRGAEEAAGDAGAFYPHGPDGYGGVPVGNPGFLWKVPG